MSITSAARRCASILLAAPCLALAQQAPAAPPAAPAAPAGATTIAARTAGFDRRDGFIPVYLNDRTGAVWLEIPRDSTRLLFLATQATGLGSNPIGIDRGSGGTEQVARFDRHGDKVFVVFENWSYRSSGGADHRRTVDESFPASTVAALPLLAEESGKLLVDATDLVMRDWNDVGATLLRSQEGAYTVARDRSSVYKPYTRAFADNTEIDIALTFAAAAQPGRVVGSICWR